MCCKEDNSICVVLCELNSRSCAVVCLYSFFGLAYSLVAVFCDVINLSVLVFLALTVVPVKNGAVVTCDTAVNLCLFAAFRAKLINFRKILWQIIDNF